MLVPTGHPFPKLQLNGIMFRPLKPTVPLKSLKSLKRTLLLKPLKPPETSATITSGNSRGWKRFLANHWHFVACLVCIGMAVSSIYYTMYKRRHGLRSTIHKIDCTLIRGTFTCPNHFTTGSINIVVSALCRRYIYEIGGTPFVLVNGFKTGHIVVPASEHLVIRDARPDCRITAHRSSHSVLSPPIANTLIWITSSKHSAFTLTVDGEVVLDRAPANMLQSERNGDWIAYTMDIRGNSVNIVGNAQDPIHIYGDKLLHSA